MKSLSITGGGTGVISLLLRNGGGSKWLDRVDVPYSPAALQDFLGQKPDKYCSAETASKMAVTSMMKSIEYGCPPDEAEGIGVTSILKRSNTSKPEIYEDTTYRKYIAYLAKHTIYSCFTYQVEFGSYLWRSDQEDELANIIYNFINSKYSHLDYLFEYYSFRDISHLYSNSKHIYCIGYISPNIFSGSFNPIHDGHKGIIKSFLRNGHKFNNEDVTLEISIKNFDKGWLDIRTINQRLSGLIDENQNILIDGVCGILLTNFDRFIDKAKHLSNCNFIIGDDTFDRLCPINDLPILRNYGTTLFIAQRNNNLSEASYRTMYNDLYLLDYKNMGHSSTEERTKK